jgi:hypothetical protein
LHFLIESTISGIDKNMVDQLIFLK